MTALYCQKDPGSPPFSSPARCILAQRPQLVKSSRSPNATRNLSSLPLPPPARPLRSPTALRRANVFFFPPTPSGKDSGRGTVRPQRVHEEPQEPFGIPGMVRLALFSFQIAWSVLTPAKKSCVLPKHSGPSPVKTTEILSWLLGQTVAPVQNRLSFRTFHNPTRLRRLQGAGDQSSYPSRTVEVEAGLSVPLIVSSSTHPTCASGSCQCIHWHLPLFLLSAASASYPAESPPDLIHLQPAAKAQREPRAACTDPQALPPLIARPKLNQLRCHFLPQG